MVNSHLNAYNIMYVSRRCENKNFFGLQKDGISLASENGDEDKGYKCSGLLWFFLKLVFYDPVLFLHFSFQFFLLYCTMG